MESIQLQLDFFQHIKSKLPPHLSFVEEIAELLNISTDSAYRRIRGEKQISLEEVQKLCTHFHLSLDHVLSIESNSTVFFGDWVDVDNFDFARYLEDMLLQLQLIAKGEKIIMYFEAKDIPPFHHFQFPDLAAFKYFFWMKTILAYPALAKENFESHPLAKPLQDTGKKIIALYTKIPSVEIWSVETINSTIRQIEYYKDAGVFIKRETIEQLYNELLRYVDHLEKQAECGEKFLLNQSPGGNTNNFQLYFNEVILGHNTILSVTDERKTVFINHGVLNYMITRDNRFCDYTYKSMLNIMRKSSLISSVSEKERNRFFHVLKDKIERRKREL
jgi:hypothetical protein